MEFLVIKCGGSVLESLPDSFYKNVVAIQKEGRVKPVIVHGGGPLISSVLEKLGVNSTFIDGLRVTTNEMLDVVEMVLSGSVNKKIVSQLKKAGGTAVGISGVDGGLIQAKPVKNAADIGFVGEVEKVNGPFIRNICMHSMIPVISPIGIDLSGQRYNINGDSAASAIARALKARFCLISNIPGIYTEADGKKSVLHQVSEKEIKCLIEEKQITGGMLPKVTAALDSLSEKVTEAVILNGLEEESLLKFYDGKKSGTKIIKKEDQVHA
ncbi:acetylglutamate kinase [Pseudalkalibacillus caeni]|uniref:Acetylglutamate kinase n=1 Tax=Exobacillus caeni TaxID=2574798 RepID=A0A5R9F1H2_9BACL|nr:acetylglutamate kinase [Pseudalkalibacillus caeni]TLS36861.1 acetylglutamate kinase [Pseudalkalibacillus caeni]